MDHQISHTKKVNIFKVKSANELNTDSCVKMIVSFMALKSNSILINTPPVKDIMILLYQISKVDGDLPNPTIKYFGISGFGKRIHLF